MTTKAFLRTTALFAAILALFAACKPVEPKDETQNKLHDDPVKMVVRLVECHLHAPWNKVSEIGGIHQNPPSKGLYLKRMQQISYELKEGVGWQLSEGSDKQFYVKQNALYTSYGEETPAPVYLLFIDYYDRHGKLMNGQFVENGQDRIHRHFFIPENVKPTFDGVAEADDSDPSTLVDYLYLDTTPWNKTHHSGEAKITGRDNPIGFKGCIRFLKVRKSFDLRIRLYHGYQSKVNPLTGKHDPFYKPGGVLVQQGTWDVNLAIPVTVLMNNEELIDVEERTDPASIPEDGLDETSNRALHSIMHAFGISWEEAIREYIRYVYQTDNSGENAPLWI